jgi:stearoyl-CoA desaturase (delta-9 desaturase)
MPPLFFALFAAFVVTQLALAATTVYLHRTLSHRALTLSPGVSFAFRLLLWTTTGIRPRQWVAVHRKHHAYTDVVGDPHSPILEGFAKVQFNNVGLYRRVAKDQLTVRRYARDIPTDRWDTLLFDHALVGLAIGISLLCLSFGWKLGLVAAVAHTALYLMLNAAINAIGHLWGRQPHDNRARNNQWLAWLTVGEGLHNNHHAAPTSARLALQAGERDPGWWVVRFLARRGLAQVRHESVHLKAA